jgi:hypothetical protein
VTSSSDRFRLPSSKTQYRQPEVPAPSPAQGTPLVKLRSLSKYRRKSRTGSSVHRPLYAVALSLTRLPRLAPPCRALTLQRSRSTLRSSGSSATTATGSATAVVLPQSYAFFRELPVHDAGSLERPFRRASTASETLSLASRPPMRLCALQRLRPSAAATERLASPSLPAPAGFLTLWTPYLRREPSGLVSCR